MSDFDEILKKMREGLGEMAAEAQAKYNDLVAYLDSHDSDEIKADLKKMAEKATSEVKEGAGKAKEEWDKLDVKEKLNDMREDLEEGMGKAKSKVEEIKKDYQEGKYDDKINDAREKIEDGMDKAKELVGTGLNAIQKQWEELRKQLNI